MPTSLLQPTTHSILYRVANNDPAAMRECIGLYGSIVWSLAKRFTRSAADAEDATQEIFLKVWRYAHRFDPTKGSEQGFIALIARRFLIDRLRQRALEPPTRSLDEELPGLAEDAAYGGVSSQVAIDANIAVHVLAGLRPEQRLVIELAFWKGLTHSEIALQLDMPLGTVKSFMRRGLLSIRNAMTKSDPSSTGLAPVAVLLLQTGDVPGTVAL